MFVVFEGIDGSGKTTISNRVAEKLRSNGVTLKHMRAEGKFASSVTEAVRELGRDVRNIQLVPQAEFLLYVAREVQLIEEALRPALAENDVVLADRFLNTPEVLGRHGRHLPADWTAPILKAAAGGIVPDLVVLVDIEPVLARARRKAAKIVSSDARPPSRKGLGGVGLQHRLRRGYLELAAAEPDRWVVVDNEDALDDTVARVAALLEEARRAGAKTAIEHFRDAAAKRQAAARSAPPSIRTPQEGLEAFLRWIDVRSEREPRAAAYLLSGLYGPGVDERRRALAPRVPEVILAGMSGLDDATSWALRRQLRESHPVAVAATLNGIPSTDPQAAALREALLHDAPAEVVKSLGWLDEPAAWAVRERLFDTESDALADAIVGSLGGIGTEQAWKLREQWLARVRYQIGKSNDELLGTSYEVSRVAAKTVASLDDERSWQIRKRSRPGAPVAALASLAGLQSERSWKWRHEYLMRAPKVVMGTIRRMDSPEAWKARQAVAADCKEAIDSISWMDQEEAWALRVTYQDVWSSTVLKTLGPLANTPRGRAFVERQLSKYPTNVSMLKHAAGIALGCHAPGMTED